MSTQELLSLNDIFHNRFFRIPDFQRGFSWGKDELQDFWDDLSNLKPGQFHYFGLLTVEELADPDSRKVGLKKAPRSWELDTWLFKANMRGFHIIDGQQRLTSSIILINEIIQNYPLEQLHYKTKHEWISQFLFKSIGGSESSGSFLFGYEANDPSNEYLKTKILNYSSLAAANQPDTLYTRNLQFAKTFFQEKVAVLMNDKDLLADYFDKLVNRLKFNFYPIDQELDIYVTFETMNNRGKELSKLELLKNRLIYITTLLPIKDPTRQQLRQSINDTWRTIYEYLGKDPEFTLDDDDFLHNHWIMYFQYDRSESSRYAKFLLKDMFTGKEVQAGRINDSTIKEYLSSLQLAIQAWYQINTLDGLTSKPLRLWLRRLHGSGFGAFRPLIMGTLVRNEPEEQIIRLLSACERFNFLVFDLSHRYSNTRDSHFFGLASDYYHSRNWQRKDKESETDLDRVILEIQLLTDGLDGDKYAGWFDINRFFESIKDEFDKKKGFYSWKGIKYFLFEYEESIRMNARNNDVKVKWSDYSDRDKDKSIEHILPQDSSDSEWQLVLKGYSQSQVEKLTHSLGNLLLINTRRNSSHGKLPFAKKKSRIDSNRNQIGYVVGSYSEAGVADNFDSWTAESILKRGISMLKFIEKHWNIQLENPDKGQTYTKLLGLEFLKLDTKEK